MGLETMIPQAGGAVLGMVLGGINDERQINQQTELQNLQIRGQKEMTDYSMQKQMEMWKNTNYGAQVEQMNKAGINPALLYGKGGGGGTTTGSPSGNVSGAAAPTGGREIQDGMGLGIQTAAQIALLQAQKANVEADTANKTAGTGKAVAETGKTVAETENVPKTGLNIEANTGLTNVKTAIAELEKVYTGETMEARIMKTNSELEKINQEIRLITNNAEIAEETKSSRVTQIRAEAIGAVIRNKLTRVEIENKRTDTELKGAQIGNVRKDTELKQAGIMNIMSGMEVNDAQINKMSQEVAQKWETIDIEKFKAEINASYPGLWNVIGGEVESVRQALREGMGEKGDNRRWRFDRKNK